MKRIKQYLITAALCVVAVLITVALIALVTSLDPPV
jgi:hypothetical protein